MSPHPLWRRVAGVVGRGFALLLVVLLTGWAMAALYFDLLSGSSLRHVTVSGYGIAMLGTLLAFRGRDKGIAICIAAFVLVLAWWLTLKPSNDRAWQPDVRDSFFAGSAIAGLCLYQWNFRCLGRQFGQAKIRRPLAA